MRLRGDCKAYPLLHAYPSSCSALLCSQAKHSDVFGLPPHCPLPPPLCYLPPAAKAVQVIAEVLAVLYAEAALLVQLQALLRANMFLAKYR